MKPFVRHWSLVCCAVLVVLFGLRTEARALVISDGRLETLGSGLVVGSGYATATNLLHTPCFPKGSVGNSTFSMDYNFEEIDDQTLQTLDREAREFVLAHSKEKPVPGQVTKHLLAVLTIDEKSSPLAEEAKGPTPEVLALVRRGDLSGFYASCGSHYVRSIRRRSRYLSLFSYSMRAGDARDAAFERDLMLSVTSFDPDKDRSAGEKARAQQIAQQSGSRSLRVSVKAIGLGPQPSAMIPFDMETYRTALQAAFRASQLEGTGEVIAIEISGWLQLPAILDSLDSLGHGTNFAQKQILRENADYYLEILRETEEAREIVHRAEICRRTIDYNYRDADGILQAGFSKKTMLSDKGGKRPLSVLIEAVSDEQLEELNKASRDFTNRIAGDCLSKLEEASLKTSYRDIESCVGRSEFSFPTLKLIRHYCPPLLAAQAAGHDSHDHDAGAGVGIHAHNAGAPTPAGPAKPAPAGPAKPAPAPSSAPSGLSGVANSPAPVDSAAATPDFKPAAAPRRAPSREPAATDSGDSAPPPPTSSPRPAPRPAPSTTEDPPVSATPPAPAPAPRPAPRPAPGPGAAPSSDAAASPESPARTEPEPAPTAPSPPLREWGAAPAPSTPAPAPSTPAPAPSTPAPAPSTPAPAPAPEAGSAVPAQPAAPSTGPGGAPAAPPATSPAPPESAPSPPPAAASPPAAPTPSPTPAPRPTPVPETGPPEPTPTAPPKAAEPAPATPAEPPKPRKRPAPAPAPAPAVKPTSLPDDPDAPAAPEDAPAAPDAPAPSLDEPDPLSATPPREPGPSDQPPPDAHHDSPVDHPDS